MTAHKIPNGSRWHLDGTLRATCLGGTMPPDESECGYQFWISGGQTTDIVCPNCDRTLVTVMPDGATKISGCHLFFANGTTLTPEPAFDEIPPTGEA